MSYEIYLWLKKLNVWSDWILKRQKWEKELLARTADRMGGVVLLNFTFSEFYLWQRLLLQCSGAKPMTILFVVTKRRHAKKGKAFKWNITVHQAFSSIRELSRNRIFILTPLPTKPHSARHGCDYHNTLFRTHTSFQSECPTRNTAKLRLVKLPCTRLYVSGIYCVAVTRCTL